MRRLALALSTILSLTLAAGEALPGDPTPARSRLGMNLAGTAYWSTEHPFVDVFKTSRVWISQKKGQPWGEGARNRPRRRRLGPQARRGLLGRDAAAHRGARAVGRVRLPVRRAGRSGDSGGSQGGVGRARRGGGGRGRAQGGVFLQLKATDPADPVRDIRVLMPGTEKTYREQPFSGFRANISRPTPFSLVGRPPAGVQAGPCRSSPRAGGVP